MDVRGPDAGVRQGRERAPEALGLGARLHGLDRVGGGEVREHAGDLDTREVAQRLAEGAHVGQVEAEPGHAGIHLHVQGDRAPGRPARRRQGPRGVQAPHRDREVVRRHQALFARERPAQDDDRLRDAGPPELHALLDQRHAERRRAPLDEGACRRHRTVAVTVRLHHRHHRHPRAHQLAGPAAVGTQSRQAHLGDRGPPVVVRHGENARRGKALLQYQRAPRLSPPPIGG